MKSHSTPLKKEKTAKGFSFGHKQEHERTRKGSCENILKPAVRLQPTEDFSSAVERGKLIKDRIRQAYNEKFPTARVEQEAEYARDIMQYASLATKSTDLYGATQKLSQNTKHSHVFHSEDLSIPKHDKVGVFPVSDQKHFPTRYSGSSWQAGLRQYGEIYATFDQPPKTTENIVPEPVQIHENEDTTLVTGKSRSIHEFSLTESKKTQYVSRSLPELTPYLSSHYFGEDAIHSYNQTYKQLNRQAHLLLGGYSELHALVKEEKALKGDEFGDQRPSPNRNIFTLSASILREQSVLTPRESAIIPSGSDSDQVLTAETEQCFSEFPSSCNIEIKQAIETVTNNSDHIVDRLDSHNNELVEKSREEKKEFSLPVISPTKSTISKGTSKPLLRTGSSIGTTIAFEDEQISSSRPNTAQKQLTKQRSISAAIKKENVSNTPKSNQSFTRSSKPKISTSFSMPSMDSTSSAPVKQSTTQNLSFSLDLSLAPEGDNYSIDSFNSVASQNSATAENTCLPPPEVSPGSPNKLKGILKSPVLSASERTLKTLHEELRNKIQDNSYNKIDDDIACNLSYQPASPRAIFLSGCLAESLPPRSQMLIRKRLSSTMDLAHIGIGNHMAMVLAEAIATLPYLQAINLADNHLQDTGLSALIRAIARHPTVEILDISQNVIDEQAAEALADFIGNADCELKCLRMSDSNIDDGECAAFVDVLMHNCHLKELDMSKNLIGKDENLNTVQPDFVTGSESLADLIKIGSCPIETLNLHWNMIRLEGAEVLCDAIRNNQYLMHLDLSYNALGRNAACVLGGALIDNKMLRVLKVGNNGIDAIGCFTLLVGLRENNSLRELSLDGNPIGEQGARILMKLVALEGHRLKISSKNCDFNIRSSDVKFHLDYPFGEYLLTLSQPYDRAILMELLETVANDTNVEISVLEYSETASLPNSVPPMSKSSSQPNSRPTSAKLTGNTGGVSTGSRPVSAASSTTNFATPQLPGGQLYRVVKFEEPRSDLSKEDMKELDDLQSFAHVQDLTLQQLVALAKMHDIHKKDSFNMVGLKKIISALDIHPLNRIVSEISFSLDPMETQHFDINDFVEYMIRRIMVAKQRIRNIHHRPCCAVHRLVNGTVIPTEKQIRYVPPMVGRVRVRVSESYDVGDNSQVQSFPLSNAQCIQMIRAAQLSTNPLQLMLYGIDSFKLYLEEAQALFLQIGVRSDDPILALAKILLRMQNASDAMRMIRNYTCSDVFKARRLKQKLGKAYYPLIGIYSGFYSLDLSNEFDRICLRKLIEKSVRNMETRRKQGKWDTSQHGTWSCFRNEVHYRAFQSGEMPTISPKYFFPIPHKGRVEFDFINIERPNPQLCHPAHEDRILDVLLLSRLLEEDQVDHSIIHLNDLNMAMRRSMVPDGNPYWKPDFSRSVAVADHLFTMYNNLSQRSSFVKKALKREAAKTMPVAVPEKPKLDRRKTADTKGVLFGASSGKKGLLANSMAKQALIVEAMASGLSKNSVKMPTNKLKQAITTFRSLTQRGKYDLAVKHWGKRLYDVMGEPNAYDEYKAATLLEYFESELAPLWLYCKHVSLILELFASCGLAMKSNMGTYRVELLILLYDRIVDLHNFEIIMMVLSAEEQASIHARIGILNFFNPCKPEGGFSLDLVRWEERQITKMLIHLSVVEPGENWLNKGFIFDRGFSPIPGWDLNITWLSEEGLPKKGLLSFEMFAGDGIRSLGCCVDIKLRMILTSLVCVEQRDYVGEITRSDMLHDDMYYKYTYHKKGQREAITLHPKDQVSTKIIPPLKALPSSGSASSIPIATARSSAARSTGSTSSRTGNGNGGSAGNSGRRASSARIRAPSAGRLGHSSGKGVAEEKSNEDEDDIQGNVSGQDSSIIISGVEDDLDEEGSVATFGMHKVVEHFNQLPSYQERLLLQANILGTLWEKTVSEASLDGSKLNCESTDQLSQSLSSEHRIYTFEDANRHLRDEADVQWSYSTNFKIDSWV